MASLQQQQQQQYQQQEPLPTPLPHVDAETNNGNINVDFPRVSIPQEEIYSQEETFSSPAANGVNGNLIQVQPEATNNVATDNQQQAKLVKDSNAQSREELFQSPIVVGEQQQQANANATVIVQPSQTPFVFPTYQSPQKQFNLQILTDTNAAANNNHGQFLEEVSASPKIVNGHTNSNNFQYLVEDDQDFKDSTPTAITEAPSRQFLKKFKNFRTYEHSTTAQSYSVSTSRSIVKPVKEEEKVDCCKKDKSELKVLEITQRPELNSFELAPVHAGIRLTNEKLDDCVDGHPPPIVEVQKNVNVVIEDLPRIPAYGDRIIVTTPATRIVTQPIFIEKPQVTKIVQQPVIVEKAVIKEFHVPVEKPVYIKSPPKIIDRPVFIKSPPEIKIVHQQLEAEKVIVDRPVYIKSPPETRIVHQPVVQTVEKIVEKPVYIEKIVRQPYEVEKIVDRPVIQTVEKPVYIEKFIDRPVERIVEKPVVQTVETPVYIEKFVDRPVEKFIDRPYPVPYAVGIPYEKHVHHKPDFHVIAKSIPYKHKLFDFEGLFGFLGKKKEVKHIYVPSSQQHQLKQLNHHQLIASSLTTIDPVQEAPVLDYSRYATTHLNPIKPIYGVPSTPLAPVHPGYSYRDPYAGKKLSISN